MFSEEILLGGVPEARNHQGKRLLLLLLLATCGNMSLGTRCNKSHTAIKIRGNGTGSDESSRGWTTYLEASINSARVEILPAFVAHGAKMTKPIDPHTDRRKNCFPLNKAMLWAHCLENICRRHPRFPSCFRSGLGRGLQILRT